MVKYVRIAEGLLAFSLLAVLFVVRSIHDSFLLIMEEP